jgi:hypothetical protein
MRQRLLLCVVFEALGKKMWGMWGKGADRKGHPAILAKAWKSGKWKA